MTRVTIADSAPFRGVIFDIHSTLVDQGSGVEWLKAALAQVPEHAHPASSADEVELVAFLDTIWEGARITDPESSRDLSFADHSRVFHELLLAGTGIDRALADSLYDVMLNVWHAYDDTVPALTALKAAGIRICLLSNAGVPITTVLDREGITPLVDAIVLSYEIGYVKPDRRIFEAALTAISCAPEETLMVGDSGKDDAGGTALGIRTLILPRTTGRIHGLQQVLNLVS